VVLKWLKWSTRGATLDVDMVFVIPKEFRAPDDNGVAQLCIGVEQEVFEKPARVREHLKPLYIKGHLDSTPVGRMMVDGGASVNIMPVTVFEKLGHTEGDLKQTNMSLNGFFGEPAEAKGIISKELTVGSKTLPTAFFIVDVRGRYNVLLGRDWIHANGSSPQLFTNVWCSG
jgi:hypothetical protein